MEKFVIHGGKPLVGEVEISGAKNAAVAILPATILAGGKCVIENLPNISDVSASVDILSAMGAHVRVINKHTLEIDTAHITATSVPNELSRQMRASYYFLGALLGRFGKATVAMPGGCNLGPRPIDQHLKAFVALGAKDSVEYGMISVESDSLRGEDVFFDTVSVGATINAMLAAVMAEGQTVLENVAKEPHIVDVANFLNMMGADVRGAGTDVIKIRGVKQMHGCTYSIIPDQIEAGSYMVAATITGGNVLIKNVIPKHLEPITSKLEKAGAPKFNRNGKGYYKCIIGSDAKFSLLGDALWEDKGKYQQAEQIENGEIGKLFGVIFIESSEAPVYAKAGASEADVGVALVFGEDAYGVVDLGVVGASPVRTIVKPLGSAGTADPLDQMATIGWKVDGFAAVILNQNWLVRVEHAIEA